MIPTGLLDERVVRTKDRDLRFETPLYTVAEAAAYLRVPRATFRTWAQGQRSTGEAPIITAIPGGRGAPEIPFIGLAEAMVLAAFRNSGVPMQRVRAVVEVLQSELGLDHALASKRLCRDGAEIFHHFATKTNDDALRELTVASGRRRLFVPVIQDYLRRIAYAPDGWARQLTLLASNNVIIDPERAFGQPIFAKGAVRVEDVLDRFGAGDSVADVAYDFDVRFEDIEEAIRVALTTAA